MSARSLLSIVYNDTPLELNDEAPVSRMYLGSRYEVASGSTLIVISTDRPRGHKFGSKYDTQREHKI